MAKKFPKLSQILKKLLFDKEMKPVDLARELDIPQPTIHRLVTGKSTRPYKSSLKPIADYFSLSIEQLVGEEPLDGSSAETKKLLKPSGIQTIPLIEWEDIQNLDQLNADQIKKEVAVTNNLSEHSFALIMMDTSMAPAFQRDSILIFDPSINHKDRSFVLVKLKDSHSYVFRQLLIDLDHKYLKPLNPDLSSFQMRLLNNEDEIIACLVESRFNYQAM